MNTNRVLRLVVNKSGIMSGREDASHCLLDDITRAVMILITFAKYPLLLPYSYEIALVGNEIRLIDLVYCNFNMDKIDATDHFAKEITTVNKGIYTLSYQTFDSVLIKQRRSLVLFNT